MHAPHRQDYTVRSVSKSVPYVKTNSRDQDGSTSPWIAVLAAVLSQRDATLSRLLEAGTKSALVEAKLTAAIAPCVEGDAHAGEVIESGGSGHSRASLSP